MTTSAMGFAKHLSIVWGITLAVITLVEWNSLDRDPMRKEIMSPFIGRDISVSVDETSTGNEGEPFLADAGDEPPLRYEVEFHFNGPLFLVGFFLPVLIFYGFARVWVAVGRLRSPPAD